MTTSNAITMDHIRSFFSLDREVEHVNVAATATGGLGIDNLDQFPPPKPVIRKKFGTDYSRKYIQEDKLEEKNKMGRQTLVSPGGSTININKLDDAEDSSLDHIEELSLLSGDFPKPNEVESELTHQLYSTYYNTDVKYDPNLTITSYREQILKLLNISPVIIVQGSTGCGKTTQVPQYILDHHASRGTYCNIVVTQPRKIAATSIARRVCQERGWHLGTLVGYQVAMDNKTSDDTRLSYVTTGVLLQKLVNNKRMDMYTHVIIDEVHERDQDTDFALLVVKKLLRTNSRRVKVILMSATIDTSLFAKYFSFTTKGDPAPVIEIAGKSKEVTEHYLPELAALGIHIPDQYFEQPEISPDLYQLIVRLMFYFDKIEKSEQNIPAEEDYAPARGAVLIFLPGYDEIANMSNELQTFAFARKFWILPLHSTITLEEQTRVFREAPPNHRKVIISTNIAESSITVPDIRYVIDFCLTKSLVCDPDTNYTCLQLEWASKANCTQRKGRAGRVEIGRVYRLVSRQFYEQLPDYGIPEMQRCPLTQTILHTKKLDFGPPQALLALALQPPNLSDIENAMLQLKEALAINVKPGGNVFDGDLTFMGQVMANLPLDVKLSKLILFGFLFDLLEECIIIAASLSLKNFFAKPFQKLLDAYKSQLNWADGTFSDCLCYLKAFKEWKRYSVQGQFKRPGGQGEKAWGEYNFIQIRRIREVDLLVKELKKRLVEFDIIVESTQERADDENKVLLLKIVIAAAFFPNYYLQEEVNVEEVMRQTSNNDPLSTVIVSNLPPNQGLLYAVALRDLLSCCGSRMNIEFEERKAYIRFDGQPSQNTFSVLPAVYLAVKMRQLRIPLEITLFTHEDAQSKIEQLTKLKKSDSSCEKRLCSNRFFIRFDQSTLNRVPLPAIHQSFVKIFISHFENCGYFWARYVDHQTMNVLNFLETTINGQRGQNLSPLNHAPELDMIVLAPFSDVKGAPPLYYRAQIQEIWSNKAKVFFIDYGNTAVVDKTQLREIDEDIPDILTTPAMAFECSLSQVKPSVVKCPSGQWSPAANRWFVSVVSGKTVSCQIFSVIQNVVRLEPFISKSDGGYESITKQLISMKFAEPAEETYASKQNNELRKKCSNYVSGGFPSEAENFAIQVSTEDLGDLRTTGRRIRLHGPSNPLEVNYSGMTYLDSTKPVKVERDSVNSVTFNSECQSSCPTMLVAGYVSISQNSDVLCARSTTLMPKIHGLPSLICLIFAPYIELRCDTERKSLTGALCGLGYDQDTGESLYPDHDIEIDFDVEFDKDDISSINLLRSLVNLLYGKESGSPQLKKGGIKKLQDQIRGELRKLLERKRVERTPTYYRKRYCWRQIPCEFQQHPEVPPDLGTVLPPITEISLIGDVPDESDLKRHVRELYDLNNRHQKGWQYEDTSRNASYQSRGRQFEPTRCKLCSEDLKSARDLLVHLDSEKHIKKETQLFAPKYSEN